MHRGEKQELATLISTITYLNHFPTVEKIKRDLDRHFGCPWQVIAGESFSFSIDYDNQYLYYLLYGPIAILAYKVGWKLQSLYHHFAYT